MEREHRKYLLPKGYLSWSALTLWMKNPERFKFEYFSGGDKLDTKYLKYGKGFASLVEELNEIQKRTGSKDVAVEELAAKHSLDDNMKSVLLQLDTDGDSECEILVEVAGVPILSYLDLDKPKDNSFNEYKTGKIPWTQAKVQKHDQLTLYATVLKWKRGIMPDHCTLTWIETHEQIKESESDTFWRTTEKELKVTGRMIEFHRTFDEREITRMELLLIKCAEEIDQAYRQFINEI